MTIDKHAQVFNVDVASYTTEDDKESVDRELARQDRDSLSDDEELPSREEMERYIQQEVEIAMRQGVNDIMRTWSADRQALAGTAPPAHVRGMAEQWGLRMTQEDDGRWRVANIEGESSGPNLVYLQRCTKDLAT